MRLQWPERTILILSIAIFVPLLILVSLMNETSTTDYWFWNVLDLDRRIFWGLLAPLWVFLRLMVAAAPRRH